MPGSPYQSLVQKVRQYLREGNAPAAFTALQAAQPPLPGEIDDRLVILTGRWNSSQQAYQLGTLTAEQAQAGAAQVQLSILDLLTSLEEMSEEEAGQVAGESPYMGLRFFDTADARLFFGRDELTSQ